MWIIIFLELQSATVAIIVPEIEAIREWAGRRSMPTQSFTWLCSSREIRRLIQEEIQKLGGEAQRKYYEIVSSRSEVCSTNF